MKQILQNLGTGETLLAEVPCPQINRGGFLIETSVSLLSLGTEKMLLDFGKANLLNKARQQPEKVKQVLQKVRTDGLGPTIDAVRAKLDQPIPLGYSNVGYVVESLLTESGGIQQGDRVVSNGHHAEMVTVPRNLCARVPDGVSDEEAAFTVVGAIGLQGIRLLQPTLGERVVVMGLGLIGLLCVQMLRAQGCQVLGTDFDERKLALARKYGAETVNLGAGEDAVAIAEEWTRGVGVDGVVITAATKSDEPVHQAATMCRQRGKIVLVGVVGLQLQRSDFYEKELSFQVSCSYGPGRYDPTYEQRGADYPIGHVRWTEQRNFEAVLQLLVEGRLDVRSLITHRAPFSEALSAYERVSEGKELGILLEYETKRERAALNGKGATSVELTAGDRKGVGKPVVAFLGAGGYTTRMLLPALEGQECRLKTIVSSSGVSSTHAGNKFGFEHSSSDSEAVLADEEVDTVFITTRHNSHAALVKRALEAGKNVFVEKPLCLKREELEEIADVAKDAPGLLMIGFNRRFSPHIGKMHEALRRIREPRSVVMTINAGTIAGDHWTQDPAVGGGRIIGEACHFIDLARFLAGSKITSCQSQFLGGEAGKLGDSAAISLGFEDGSIAAIQYLARGHKRFPKERIEVFAGEAVLRCENFRVTEGFGVEGLKKFRTRSQDKGHRDEVAAFLRAVREGGEAPVSLAELLEVTEATFDVAERG